MPVQVVVGAQWGDEGKGKTVDSLASKERMMVVRYNGGGNAGHTIHDDYGQKHVVRLLPCGILHHGKTNIVGPYMVCDPDVIVAELKIAKSDVFLDHRAAIVLPMHKLLDGAREASCGDGAIGTTKRGIGPCYEDLVARRAVRLGHLRSEDDLKAVLTKGRYYQERLSTLRFHKAKAPSLDQTIAWLMSFRDALYPLVRDTVEMVHEAVRRDQHVLFEGAQGIEIDVNFGEQPYQTSSPCGAGGVAMSFGVFNFKRVIGVAKAYGTRVGGGELPTAMSTKEDKRLREAGSEVGATTGRNRRCAWLDLPRLKRACDVGGVTELVINKLDVLGKTFPEFRVCVGHAPEEYVSIAGWKQEISSIPMRERLPTGARILLDLVESQTGRPVVGIGTGPRRQDVIWKRD